jgi:hypothetical protein
MHVLKYIACPNPELVKRLLSCILFSLFRLLDVINLLSNGGEKDSLARAVFTRSGFGNGLMREAHVCPISFCVCVCLYVYLESDMGGNGGGREERQKKRVDFFHVCMCVFR